MCCVVALMGLIGPRVAFLFAWFFTDEVDQAFTQFWMKLLGLIFLPWTALFWAIAWAPVQEVSGFGWLPGASSGSSWTSRPTRRARTAAATADVAESCQALSSPVRLRLVRRWCTQRV